MTAPIRPFSSRLFRAMQIAIGLCLSLSVLAVAQASAIAPRLTMEEVGNSTAAPGSTFHDYVNIHNISDTATSGPFTLTITLPSGLTAISLDYQENETHLFNCEGDAPGGAVLGASVVTCESAVGPEGVVRIGPFAGGGAPTTNTLDFSTAVSPTAAEGTATVKMELSGGGSATAKSADPIQITPAAPPFGLDAFDAQVSSDFAGDPFTQAGGHPYSASTEFDIKTVHGPIPGFGDVTSVEPLKDLAIELPPGFIGNPTTAATCTAAQILNGTFLEVRPFCPADSQIGNVTVRLTLGNFSFLKSLGPVPLVNMPAPPGVAARFGFNILSTVVILDSRIRSGGDYGVTVESSKISEGLPIAGTTVEVWGAPAAASHDIERGCPGQFQPYDGGGTCLPESPADEAFLRNPTSCEGEQSGLPVTAHADSWTNQGARDAGGFAVPSDPAWSNMTSVSHNPPGYSFPPSEWGSPQGPTGCADVPFTPEVNVQPTTNQADSPSGIAFGVTIPQEGLREPDVIAQSDLRDVKVVLPAGMSINPSSATGLGSCSAAQIGLTTPVGQEDAHFTDTPAGCPNNAKIGSAEIHTPLLDHPVKGEVYLAKQGENPFSSLLAMYLTAYDPASGTVLKLPGKVEANPQSGQITNTFINQPQLPFEELHLELFGGSRAPLRTPASCGSYSIASALTPWSGNAPEQAQSTFHITAGPAGAPCPTGAFNPKLSAGTSSPLSGIYSPFNLRVTREDATPQISGLNATLPKGLLGKLAGISYCPDAALAAISEAEGTGNAQIASPSCPASSQVGTVTVGAGAGATPFYTQQGRAYLAGPYKGAPLSLAVVTPAVAGPFDLGTVVVRNALRIDPESTQLTAVSDPLPVILHGIPLDLRDIRVEANRPNFTLTPTSCDPSEVKGQLSGTGGASAAVSDHFQVGACERLAFKPKLSLALKGSTKRTGHPALKATLSMPQGGANIAKASVALPHSEFLDQSHIQTICTRVQYAASQCPQKSVYGHATAYSPLLEKPLSGPVYLRSSNNKLPDLVASLNGQIHVDLDGRIDTFKRGIRTTFEAVPDAPVSKFVLTMQGARKGLIENSENLCRKTQKATARFDAQNGKVSDFEAALQVNCKKAAHKKHHAKKGH